mmetsp:Transcript_10320/g.34148  ORF Transcript_10320/g.34148 Transcript_10320/m.34148 type:complete len:205 (+) Transcript_10320:122-736(+)
MAIFSHLAATTAPFVSQMCVWFVSTLRSTRHPHGLIPTMRMRSTTLISTHARLFWCPPRKIARCDSSTGPQTLLVLHGSAPIRTLSTQSPFTPWATTCSPRQTTTPFICTTFQPFAAISPRNPWITTPRLLRMRAGPGTGAYTPRAAETPSRFGTAWRIAACVQWRVRTLAHPSAPSALAAATRCSSPAGAIRMCGSGMWGLER